jgi:hypothetical protein
MIDLACLAVEPRLAFFPITLSSLGSLEFYGLRICLVNHWVRDGRRSILGYPGYEIHMLVERPLGGVLWEVEY